MSAKILYEKPVLSIDKLINHIINNKWFSIKSTTDVKEILTNYGYYHLSSYMKCFYSDTIKDTIAWSNIDFIQSVYHLYELERQLSYLLLNKLLKIERILKAHFIAFTTEEYQDAFWYTNSNNLTAMNLEGMLNLIKDIEEKNSSSSIVSHYRNTYRDQYMPIWHIVEIASLWPFTKLYNYLKQDMLDKFVEKYQCSDTWTLKIWLKGLTTLRNRIAHGEILRSKSKLPKIWLPFLSPDIKINTIRSYIQLLWHLLSIISENEAEEFKQEISPILTAISNIQWLSAQEKQRIGINNGNWRI